MRPIASKDDESNAFALFYAALYDDPDAFTALVPNAVEPRPFAIAEDGSSAEFEIYAMQANWWEPKADPPIGRVIVERSGKTPN
jgi:hypothetical protein